MIDFFDNNEYIFYAKLMTNDIDNERFSINDYDEIISIQDIKNILTKYNIGKRNLSLLLGFGEINITRYLNGVVPTLPKSRFLKEILYSPKYYYLILYINQRRINFNAFYKSLIATSKLIEE